MRGDDLAVVADRALSLDAAERLYICDRKVAVYDIESVRNVFVGGLQAKVRAGVRQHLLGPGEDFIGGTRQPFLTGVVEFKRRGAQVGGVYWAVSRMAVHRLSVSAGTAFAPSSIFGAEALNLTLVKF